MKDIKARDDIETLRISNSLRSQESKMIFEDIKDLKEKNMTLTLNIEYLKSKYNDLLENFFALAKALGMARKEIRAEVEFIRTSELKG